MLTTRQQHCLRGIGIDLWTEREVNSGSEPAAKPVTDILSVTDLEDIRRFQNGDRPRLSGQIEAPTNQPQNGESDLEKRDLSPVSPPEDQPNTDALPPSPAPEVDAPAPAKLDSWDAIIESIHRCTACELAQNCTRKVPGVGNREADLLIVGEGPGHDEDIRGEPFVGRSGQLLDRMLAAIGITREQVYITNIVKCRPPDNRDPKQQEAQQCRSFLEAQIELRQK
jgi:DNA polymerase